MPKKILVGCTIADLKAYALEPYLEGLKKLTYPYFDILLSAFENSLKEFESHLSSKTAARVLTSYVWMQEQLENKLNRQLKPLLRALETLQTEDKSLKNNIDASTKHAKELILTLQDLIITYKQAASMTDMQIKWNHILRKMKEHTTHLRNRTNITKGLLKAQKEQEKDPRSWLPF